MLFYFPISCGMTRREKYQFVIAYFRENMPEAETELDYEGPYQLLVAVILSAQCTDKRVNLTTPAFFRKYPNTRALAKASEEDVYELIKSISYPNNKTRHLLGMARMVEEKFGGEIPMKVEDLVQLPGVGRKTANVVTSVIENQPNLAVDTHVFRVSRRVGLVPETATTPLAVEKHLLRYLPQSLVHRAHQWLILHGRYVCVARRPRCEECGIRPACRYFQRMVKKRPVR